MRWELGQSAAEKACAKWPKAAEQDSALTFESLWFCCLLNFLEWMASIKALRIWCFSVQEKLFRKKPWCIPMEEMKVLHLEIDCSCLLFVSDAVAAAWAIFAEVKRSIFHWESLIFLNHLVYVWEIKKWEENTIEGKTSVDLMRDHQWWCWSTREPLWKKTGFRCH